MSVKYRISVDKNSLWNNIPTSILEKKNWYVRMLDDDSMEASGVVPDIRGRENNLHFKDIIVNCIELFHLDKLYEITTTPVLRLEIEESCESRTIETANIDKIINLILSYNDDNYKEALRIKRKSEQFSCITERERKALINQMNEMFSSHGTGNKLKAIED